LPCKVKGVVAEVVLAVVVAVNAALLTAFAQWET
jgi:hypothetical protein